MTQMRTRRLGRTGLLVSEFGFGAASTSAEQNVAVATSYHCMTPAQRERLRRRAQAFLAGAARAV